MLALANDMRKNSRTFQENLSTICDELRLAKKWGKNSILLTTHKSIYSQNKLKKALQQKIAEFGYVVVDIAVNNIKGNFIAHIANHDQIANTVFFISISFRVRFCELFYEDLFIEIKEI